MLEFLFQTLKLKTVLLLLIPVIVSGNYAFGQEFTLEFVSSDLQHINHLTINSVKRVYHQKAWLNETVNAEIRVKSNEKANKIMLRFTDFFSKQGVIDHKCIQIRVFKKIISENSIGKCGNDKKKYVPVLVADLLEKSNTLGLKNNDGAFYLSIKVPKNIKPGNYRSTIQLIVKNKILSPKLIWIIEVLPRKLPDLAKSDFYLNIWQNPYAVSNYYHVKPWSALHFKLLKPVMKLLEDAGQKCITASFFWNTFNVQSEGLKNAMIITRRSCTGTWGYDYSHFDAWIQFMLNLGIKHKIVLFGLDPWYPNYWYWDNNMQQEVKKSDLPGTRAYISFWTPFLTSFSEHMKKKGWFGRVALGIDERPEKNIIQDIAFIKSIDSGFKIELSGLYSQGIEKLVDDYAVNSNQSVPASILQERKEAHKISTYYTSCWEEKPNTLLFNQPGDAWFLTVHSLAIGMDGYSRYSYNNWSKNILIDARNDELPPGDTFFIYPGPQSSIRFEKLKEGIVFTIKWKILMNEAKSRSNLKMQNSLVKLLLDFREFKSPGDSLIATSISTLNNY